MLIIFCYFWFIFENRNQISRFKDGARLSHVVTEIMLFDYEASCLSFFLNCVNKLRLGNRSNILLKLTAKQYNEEI